MHALARGVAMALKRNGDRCADAQLCACARWIWLVVNLRTDPPDFAICLRQITKSKGSRCFNDSPREGDAPLAKRAEALLPVPRA